jgi:hypothetical protein
MWVVKENAMNQTTTMSNDEADGLDLLDSMQIRRVERRTTAGGAWVTGTMGGHRFEALLFPAHAENPEYEIDNSRISKLWLQRIEDRATVFNWDRGADIEAATPIAAKIVGLLSAGLAEFIYGE